MNVFTIRLSIVIKLSLFFGACILLTLLIAGYAFINTENKLVNNLITSLRADTQGLQQAEIEQQIDKLDETIQFNVDMLGAILGVKVYSIDDISQTVIPFFRIQEIQAIVVLDDENEIYGAYWRQEDKLLSGKLTKQFLRNKVLEQISVAKYESNHTAHIYSQNPGFWNRGDFELR